MCGSFGERLTCYQREKQVSSESVGDSFPQVRCGERCTDEYSRYQRGQPKMLNSFFSHSEE